MASTLETLKKQQDQLAARIKDIEAKQKGKLKKEDTRRKILIGAYILEQVKGGRFEKEKVMGWMDAYLTKPADRALFDLEKKKVEASTQQTAPDAKASGESATPA